DGDREACRRLQGRHGRRRRRERPGRARGRRRREVHARLHGRRRVARVPRRGEAPGNRSARMSPTRPGRLFVANWKMHKTRAEARAYAEELGAKWAPASDREIVIAPSFTLLDAARDPKGRWGLACQNVAAEPSGAFTGEVSARMAADAGCTYAIVGHSE